MANNLGRFAEDNAEQAEVLGFLNLGLDVNGSEHALAYYEDKDGKLRKAGGIRLYADVPLHRKLHEALMRKDVSPEQRAEAIISLMTGTYRPNVAKADDADFEIEFDF